MKEQVVIVGNSHFSELIYEHIKQDTNWEVLAFSANRAYIQESMLSGIPVVPIEKLDERYNTDDIKLVLAVGYGNMNQTRKKLYEECSQKGFSFLNYIHSSVLCSQKIEWGSGNIVFPGVSIDSFVKIGNGNIVLPQVMVGHDVNVSNFCTLSGGTRLGGSVSVGDETFIGMAAVIKDQVTVGANVFIGATSYVHKNVKDGRCVMPPQSKYLNERESAIFKEIYC